MTWIHLVQAALAATAVGVTVRRLLALYRDDSLHGSTFCTALESIASHAGREAAAEFAGRLPSGAFTDLTRHALAADPEAPVLHDELCARQFDGVQPLRSLARMALPLAFLGGILQLSAAFGGGQGLIALQRGLAEHIALQAALLAFSIGVGTSLFCAAAAGLLQRRGREQAAALGAVMRMATTLQ
jgi:hypothetical protein